MESSRVTKLNELQNQGVQTYAARFEKTHMVKEAQESPIDTQVKTAGRIVLMRNMGKLTFAHIQDITGRMQIAFQRDDLGEKYKTLTKLVDIADFIGVEGKVFKTHKGEISILVEDFTLLSKTMRPLPEKFHGVTDQETIYRQRYLDLIMNQESMDRFLFRSNLIKEIRIYLEDNAFLEVETPILSSIPSGATAKPFYTHHNALDYDVTLRIAPENYLKRCIAGGFERVFEFAKCFRNEGMDPSHLQEFTMLEYYASYWDFEDNMQFTEKMFEHVLQKLFGTLKIDVYGQEIDFTGPWPRLDYRELILNDCGIDFKEYETADDLRKAIKDKGLQIEDIDKYGYGNLIDALYKKVSRPKLIQPCFVIKHPIHTKPLARKSDDDPKIADTFQLLVNTWEIINAYSELVDPVDQRERFEVQAKAKAAGDDEAMEFDEDYVIAMEHGMPPMSGWGMGIDRLVSLLTSQENLKDVVLFPLMKALKSSQAEEAPTWGAEFSLSIDEKYIPELKEAESIEKEKKVYSEDPYVKEREAKVLEIHENEVVLDKTIFFPLGGGQGNDTGEINGQKVIDVKVKYETTIPVKYNNSEIPLGIGATITHVLKDAPNFKVGDTVKMTIDWEKRYRTMKHHSASHIMEPLLLKTFGEKVKKRFGSNVNDGKDRSDYLVTELTSEDVQVLEGKVNEFIKKGLPIEHGWSKDIPLLKVWECDDIKEVCGGTHVKNTSEIGEVKLKRKNLGGGKVRIETSLKD